MQYTRLGRSQIQASRIAFGCGPMGGYDFGKVDFDDLSRAVPLALDRGINLFDVADIYGLGAAEEFLGRALGKERERALIATKFGVRRTESGTTYYDNSPAWIREALEHSLRRLNTSYIDLYQIHYRVETSPWEEVLSTLDTLRTEGKLRLVGLSNIDEQGLPRTALPDWVVTIQHEFSLARPERGNVLQLLEQKHNLTPLCYGCLGQGILSARYDRDSVFDPADRRSKEKYVNFHGSTFEHNLRIVEVVREIAAASKRSAAQVALGWVTERLPSGVAIVGIKSQAQLEDAASVTQFRLSPDELMRLDAVASTVTVP